MSESHSNLCAGQIFELIRNQLAVSLSGTAQYVSVWKVNDISGSDRFSALSSQVRVAVPTASDSTSWKNAFVALVAAMQASVTKAEEPEEYQYYYMAEAHTSELVARVGGVAATAAEVLKEKLQELQHPVYVTVLATICTVALVAYAFGYLAGRRDGLEVNPKRMKEVFISPSGDTFHYTKACVSSFTSAPIRMLTRCQRCGHRDVSD